MTQMMNHVIEAGDAKVHARLEDALAREVKVDRTFELPARLHVMTVAAYLAFIGVMGVGLSSPGLVIPMAIFAIFIVAMFGVPALWVRMQPHDDSRGLRWSAFRSDGISTWTGRIAARDAMVQVLILPVLILAWGIAVVTIAALVR